MITSFERQTGYSYKPSYNCVYEYKSSKTTTRVLYCEVNYLDQYRIGIQVDRFEINRVDYFVHAVFVCTGKAWAVEGSTHMWRVGSYTSSVKREYIEKAESALLDLVREIVEKYSEPLQEAELREATTQHESAMRNLREAQEAFFKAETEAIKAQDRLNLAKAYTAPVE